MSGHPPVVTAAAADAAARRKRHGVLTAALYIGFALIAFGSNLGSQWLSLRLLAGSQRIAEQLGPQLPAYLGIVVGTGVGVVVKFLLDHAFIFESSASEKKIATKAGLYLVTSLATTVIFWGGEGLAIALLGKDDMLDAHLCSGTAGACARAFGSVNSYLAVGAAALVIGYLVKYQLDKRITFA